MWKSNNVLGIKALNASPQKEEKCNCPHGRQDTLAPGENTRGVRGSGEEGTSTSPDAPGDRVEVTAFEQEEQVGF